MELKIARNILYMITDTCLAPRGNSKGSAFLINPSLITLVEKITGDYKIGVTASAINETELQCIKSVARRFGLSHFWTFNVADRILLIYTPGEP